MIYGVNKATCGTCYKTYLCGDAITNECDECQRKRRISWTNGGLNVKTLIQLSSEKQLATYELFGQTLARESVANRIAQLLPQNQRHQVDRFVERARLTLLQSENRDKLENCTLGSLVECVLTAAECGFALDNKYAYVIPYGNKAQCQFDYKALIALARRDRVVKDVRAEVVYKNDAWSLRDQDGVQRYSFERADGDRGELVGVFAVAILENGLYRVEYMDKDTIEKIRSCSKAPNSPAWSKFYDRMARKAVIKRVLQGLLDDPGASVSRAIEADDAEYTFQSPPAEPLTNESLVQAINQPAQVVVAESPAGSVEIIREEPAVEITHVEIPPEIPAEPEEPADAVEAFHEPNMIPSWIDSMMNEFAKCGSRDTAELCRENWMLARSSEADQRIIQAGFESRLGVLQQEAKQAEEAPKRRQPKGDPHDELF